MYLSSTINVKFSLSPLVAQVVPRLQYPSSGLLENSILERRVTSCVTLMFVNSGPQEDPSDSYDIAVTRWIRND